MTETPTYGYSSDSTQRERSNEYQHYRVQMGSKNLCALVLWMKVASISIGKNNNFISLQLLHEWAHGSSRKLHRPTPAGRLCKTGWPDTEDRAHRSASYRHVDGGDQLSLGGRGTLPLRQIRRRIYVSMLNHLCLKTPLSRSYHIYLFKMQAPIVKYF